MLDPSKYTTIMSLSINSKQIFGSIEYSFGNERIIRSIISNKYSNIRYIRFSPCNNRQICQNLERMKYLYVMKIIDRFI